MSHYLVERIQTIPNISVIPNAEVVEVEGKDRLEAITVHHHDTQATERLPAAALFIFIGAEPHTEWLAGSGVTLDDKGFVRTGADIKRPLETCLPGVFAIGDVRSGSVKRVAAAVGEGAQVVAALHAFFAEAGDKPALSISSGRS
jgi:thioredoxin reductase (NADPH)